KRAYRLLRAPLAGLEEAVDALALGGEVEPLRGDPIIVVVRGLVSGAAVADEGHDAAALAGGEHARDQLERADEVRAGGSARPVSRALAQHPDRRERRRILHGDDLVDDVADERRLDAGSADALDAARLARRVVGSAGLPPHVVGRVLRIHDRDPGLVPPVPHVTAERRARAT